MRVLALGYYKNPSNLGDHLFTHAFKHLFPKIDFHFTDHITSKMLSDVDAVFLGGGSFLDQPPNITSDAFKALKNKKVFYIGVGAETNIHYIHRQLIEQAHLVAIRSNHLEKLQPINTRTIIVPDLVYSLQEQVIQSIKIGKSVLFVPNISVVPKWDDPYWKHISFQRFKLEMSRTLDKMIEDKYSIHVYPMSTVDRENDMWAAIEVINQMKHNVSIDLSIHQEISSITKLFSQYDMVITQRFHGAILAEMAGVPYISIYHHDKLRHTSYDLGGFISFFELSKENLLKEIKNQLTNKPSLPLKSNMFKKLISTVEICTNDLSE